MNWNFPLSALLVLFASTSPTLAINVDSTSYPPIYSIKDIKKETKEIKAFQKLIRQFESARKNIDYQNSILEKVLASMQKETQELNFRIKHRTQQLADHSKKKQADSIWLEDLPQAYNPELISYNKNQNFNKEETQIKRQESVILSFYGKILRDQQLIIQRMEKINSLQPETMHESYPAVQKDMKSFLANMKEEVNWMRKECYKK